MKKIILWGLILGLGGGLLFLTKEKKEKKIESSKVVELTGMLEKIGKEEDFYRYYIKLDEPFVDKVGSEPAMNYIEIPLMVKQADWERKEDILDERLGKKIVVKGEIEWGQGETRHFLINEIDGIQL